MPTTALQRRPRKGATSIEYALIAVLISTAIIASIQAYVGSAHSLYDYVADVISAAF